MKTVMMLRLGRQVVRTNVPVGLYSCGIQGRFFSETKEGTPVTENATTEESTESPKAQESAEDNLQAELEKALSERDDYKNKWMRALAEAENARTIAKRDVTSAREYAIQSFAKSMLEISDNLNYALSAAKENPSLEKVVEGVDLTKNQLLKTFSNHGLSEFGQIGDKFDPQLHEALFEYADPEKEPTTIGQVLKSGFKLHSRVIRAAQVGVIKADESTPPPPNE
mmetsp:Transcript_5249/g.7392  ORF Transcript_5249/g.7392 Transcript_5249/m.7392 type:complete len:225 (-) Transcript_5249:204-878(-)